MAVVDGPVGLVEEAGAVQQIAELRAREAVFPPVDLGGAAAPGLPLENRPVAFGEFAVETRVVRDGDHASSAKAFTAASSILWPATISSVMPVSAVTSGGIGTDGSLKAEKVSLTPTIRPSGV